MERRDIVKRLAILTICVVLLAAGAEARADRAADEQAGLVERILELQRQIDELMAKLPPESREELRRRLAELAAKPPATVEETSSTPAASPPLAPVPAADPPKAEAAPASPEATIESPPAEAETAPRAEALAAEPARKDPPPEPTWAPVRRRPRREPCNTLQLLDENADGQISSADRYWRYLYLWTDKNGDGQIQEREIESPYERRVREISLSLETFNRTKGGLAEIRLEDRVVFDLRGDGFSERSRGDDGVLIVDATALRRGDGPRLLGPGGESLEGLEPFRAGLSIKDSGGQVTALNCPRARSGGD